MSIKLNRRNFRSILSVTSTNIRYIYDIIVPAPCVLKTIFYCDGHRAVNLPRLFEQANMNSEPIIFIRSLDKLC